MSDVVIKIENLSKLYKLGIVSTGTISHDLNRFWAKIRGKEDPYLQVGETNDRSVKGKSDYVLALKDINLEVKRGERIGIIGKNGAGKSTLLKILSQVTGPSTGSAKMKGRVGSLLEVGTGFHPELSGRDNIYINGTILGMTHREVSKKLDEIVDFAGVERYLDTPVKRYSSGMMVRLGFSVAAHLEPDILIVDEVLAVGDAEFQKKAIGKMKDVSEGHGRTILFVSHNMASIKSLCNRGVLLDKGKMSIDGEINFVVNKYLSSNERLNDPFNLIELKNVFLVNSVDKKSNIIKMGDDIHIKLSLFGKSKIKKPSLFIYIKSMKHGHVFSANMGMDGSNPEFIEGETEIECIFKKPPLLPQNYSVTFVIYSEDNKDYLYKAAEILFFAVDGKIADSGFNSPHATILSHNTIPLINPYYWVIKGNKTDDFLIS